MGRVAAISMVGTDATTSNEEVMVVVGNKTRRLCQLLDHS